jgi:hypothetical protein
VAWLVEWAPAGEIAAAKLASGEGETFWIVK